VLAVIVLYNTAPQASVSFQTLRAAQAEVKSSNLRLRILLYDNTLGNHDPGPLAADVQYRSARHNAGLAAAYNRAIEIASAEGFQWLLTLDQDTILPGRFLAAMDELAAQMQANPSVAAIVPQIVGDGKVLSPCWFRVGAIPKWFPKAYIGIPAQATFAFNSGAMIRVDALEQIGGYDPWFWLDNSDARTFRNLHLYGKRIYVAGDIQVGHDLSIRNMTERMTPARYRNILLSESAFWDMEMNWLAGCERTLRLLVRILKRWRRKDNLELHRITWEFLRMRIFRSRRFRIALWREATRQTAKDFASAALRKRDLKISVCMAAYNGAQFIEAQLRSILIQLQPQDEVVIVDDCSTDTTCERIRSINDERIRLFQQDKNRGVVATFEEALRSATGDILFLSDDDDVWAPSKVKTFLDVFNRYPEVQVVTSSISVIDENDLPCDCVQWEQNGKFVAGFWQNVFKNHYQGSAMAFRASLLRDVFPFPRRPPFMYDAWIGTRNAARGGKTFFVDEPLLLYRRHSGNLSQRLHPIDKVRARLGLLWAHLRYVLSA
jgi:GT2 family glycosyltransferase